MVNSKYQIIIIISGILTILGFSNLVLKVHTTKETEHLSFIWIFLILSAQSLLILYGILNNSYGIYFPSVVLIFGILYILYIKLNYEGNKSIEDELKKKDII